MGVNFQEPRWHKDLTNVEEDDVFHGCFFFG
jgi:hypothetical protein